VSRDSILAKEDVKVPYELQYTSPLHFSSDKEYNSDGSQVMFYDQLKTIESGSTLFEVHAMDNARSKGGKLVKIADIVLTTPLVTSKWGDSSLYFRHRPIF